MKYLIIFSFIFSATALQAQLMRVDAQAFALYTQSMNTAHNAPSAVLGAAEAISAADPMAGCTEVATVLQPAVACSGVVVQEELIAGRQGQTLKDGIRRDPEKPTRRAVKRSK